MAFLFVLLLLVSLVAKAQTNHIINKDENTDSDAHVVRRNSLRGLGASDINVNVNEGEDEWWSDPYLMATVEDPLELKEIHQKSQSRTSTTSTQQLRSNYDKTLQRSSTGPVLGPMVPLLDSNLPEEEAIPEPTSRIIDGEEAPPYSFFTMLLIHRNDEWRWSGCGGTLISDCHVITAAHCFENPSTSVDGVFVNAHSPFHGNNSNVPFHFSVVERVEIHPLFDPTTNHADMAIIKLQDCVNVQELPPAMLAPDSEEFRQSDPSSSTSKNNIKDDNDGGDLTMKVLGFGSQSGNANVPADTLRQVYLPFISTQKCRDYYKTEVFDDMVCAGYAETGGADACAGDSGGPLLYYNTTRLDDGDGYTVTPLLVAITSWGVGCGLKDYPGVYIYIPFYRDWIMEIICPERQQQQQTDDTEGGAGRPREHYYYSSTSSIMPQDNTGGVEDRPWCTLVSDMATIDPGVTTVAKVSTGNNNGQSDCQKEGEQCTSGGDCCSNYCREISESPSQICTGALPTHQQQQQQTTESSQLRNFVPTKRGGAAGAKRQPSASSGARISSETRMEP